jgi:hypothetical protein
MDSNVLGLPVKRKAGRRRTRPVLAGQTATVTVLRDHQQESAEARLEQYDEFIDEIAAHLLVIVRVIKAIASQRS